ncbi:MAG: DUF5688 family protein [Lachnospiraceae bacterium]|nr:DUF5688 family protein [Lachnospiraceae bacterium]MCM1239033.1 DUF5688 family protein [Lachnospiraceae bacterium]
MNIQEFAERVRADVTAILGKEVHIHKSLKLNGLRLMGLTITDHSTNIAPTIYLDPYFHKFKETGNWPGIISDIINTYRHYSLCQRFDMDWFRDFDRVKEKIFYRLINYEANKELLEQMPYTRFLDFAKVFCIQYQIDDIGSGTISIYNNHLDTWGISSAELEAIAETNTPLLFQPKVSTIADTLKDIPIISPDDFEDLPPIHVLTNTKNINGASAICYPNILRDFSNERETDILILPSSIHDVILIPWEENLNVEHFRDMVSDVNSTLDPTEILSRNVYLYRRGTGQIEIA